MPVQGKIRDQAAYKPSHDPNDLLTPTHPIIFAEGAFDMFRVAFEIDMSDEDSKRLESYAFREVDAGCRFSITDGQIQIEVEVWDGDQSDKLYYCGDLSVKQAVALLDQKDFCMGFVPVGKPRTTVNAIQLFHPEDLHAMLKIKFQTDALIPSKRPRYWKVG